MRQFLIQPPISLFCGAVFVVAASFSTAQAQTASQSSTAEAELASLKTFLDDSYSFHQTQHFAVAHSFDTSWAERTGELLEEAYAHFFRMYREHGFGPVESSEQMVWVCFRTREQFDTYAGDQDKLRATPLDAYYSARTNRVALIRRGQRPAAGASPAVRTASTEDVALYGSSAPAEMPKLFLPSFDLARSSHELAHQLAFNSGLQARRVMYPIWLSEGLATHFEAYAVAQLGEGAPKRNRRSYLAEAHREGKLLPMSRFLTMTAVPRGEDEVACAYAQAWGVYDWLFTTRREALKQYMVALAAAEPGERSQHVMRQEFLDAFGSLAPLKESWEEYLEGLLESESEAE